MDVNKDFFILELTESAKEALYIILMDQRFSMSSKKIDYAKIDYAENFKLNYKPRACLIGERWVEEINVEDKEITSRLELNNDEIELIKDTIFTFIRFINRQYEISQTDKKVYCIGGFLYRNLERRVNLSTSIREKDL